MIFSGFLGVVTLIRDQRVQRESRALDSNAVEIPTWSIHSISEHHLFGKITAIFKATLISTPNR